MKTDIYYFTGTGNSLAIAKKISGKIENSNLISIPKIINENHSISGNIIGIVCPIYMYDMPYIVRDLIKKIVAAEYIFFVFAGGGYLGNGLKKTKELFKNKNLNLYSVFNILMPDNYTPYGSIPQKLLDEYLKVSEEKVNEIIKIVNEKGMHFDETRTGFFKTNIFPGLLYKLGYGRINIMDNYFKVDDECNGCSICVKVCPVKNIEIKDGRPQWNNQCQQCYACLHWCPKEAIQVGEKTVGIKRYHHPEIKMKDIIDSAM